MTILGVKMAGIYKAYDIRGTYPDQFNEDKANKAGKALHTILEPGPVVIGRDMRPSSLLLQKALIDGLLVSGRDVIDIGLISTPMINFSTVFLKTAGGAQVTASHNPKEYNGVKFCRRGAIPISYDSGIDTIELLSQKNEWKIASQKGTLTQKNMLEQYAQHVLSFNTDVKPLTIVVDAGNGMGGYTTNAVFGKLPIKIIPLYFELDGTFPNHDANPLEEKNMYDLQKAVVQHKADFGIAYDGDADRAMFVDNEGALVTADLTTALIAQEFLESYPGATILYDLRSSWVVKEEVTRLGGKAIMTRVGHSFIKQHLRQVNGVFAGELSGHFYFKDNFFTDSADLAFLKIINLVSHKNKKLAELVRPLRRYFASGEINSHVHDPEAVMLRIQQKYKGEKILHLDGLSIEFKDWWFNIRKSNTEPVLRLNMEAPTQSEMESKRDELLAEIRR